MSGPERERSSEEHAVAVALSLGRTVLGRELTTDESDSIVTIIKATVQALEHGFIQRLAGRVAAERTDEAVEEFLGETIDPD
jgi:hypothetical protein